MLKRLLSKKNSGGFSLIETLIGAALISITALGLGSAISHLQQSHEKSQMISLMITTESALVNAIQDPASYPANVATALQQGKNPPENFQLHITPTANSSFTISPNQTIYLDENFKKCSDFTNKKCLLMVALSGWGKDLPVPGQYSFGYTVQPNSQVTAMPALGNPDAKFTSASSYNVVVPALASDGKLIRCASANAIGILGLDSAGQAICLYYPSNSFACQNDQLPKGFEVTADPRDSHRYYLNFKCVPMRKISCPSPNYSFENFNPVALDTSSSSQSAVGKCVYIGEPKTNTISASGMNGLQIAQACAANYIPQNVTCQMGAVIATPVTCSNGQVVNANVAGITTQLQNSSNTIACQAVIPAQPCCSNDATKCAQVSVALTSSYDCELDSSHTDKLVY